MGGARGRALPARVREGKRLEGATTPNQPNDAEPFLSFLLVVGPKGSKSIRQKLESLSKEKKGEQCPFYAGFGPCSQTESVVFDGAELGDAQIQHGALPRGVLLFSRVGCNDMCSERGWKGCICECAQTCICKDVYI